MRTSDVRIETQRLILRPIEREDFDAWAAFMADEQTARFVGGVQSRAGAWRGFMTMAGAWAMDGVSMFSVIEKSSGRWAGRLGPWQPEGWPGSEVGWGIASEFGGRGYATEGATAAIDWAFTRLGWSDVVHAIDPLNVPSQKVAIRLGSRKLRQAQLPPPFVNSIVDVWGQSREEWFARKRPF
jgi:RimJ/RimL family protein N-acetyltransferase